MTDQQLADSVMRRYNALVVDGTVFPHTPEELAAVIIRLTDGTINRAGAKVVLDELAERNRKFLAAVNTCVGEMKND